MKLFKQDGESREHFIWRVYKQHQDSPSMTQEEAGELCRTELGEDYSESTYRKTAQNFFHMWEHVKTEYIKDESLLNRIDEVKNLEDNLYKQNVKTRDWLREKRKYLREEARVEQFRDSVKYIDDSLEDILIPKYESKHFGKRSAILMLSDFHIGLAIDNYWNTYNKEVFQERLTKIAHDVMKYAEMMDIGTLYVSSLGDLISGSIHGTTRLAEEMDRLEQARYAGKALTKLLFDLSDFGLDIVYQSVVGNHDRLNKNYKEHIEKESFNKLVDWYILDHVEIGKLEIDVISNQVDEEIGVFEVDGKTIVSVHGHNDSINNVKENMVEAIGVIPDIVLMGHYHNKQSDSQKGVYVNGSLCGVDDYAKKKRYFSKPSQTLLVFDDDNILDVKLSL